MNYAEVIREQLRLTISVPMDKNDRNYSRIVLSTPIEICMLSKVYQPTIFTRMMMNNFKNTENKFRSCPYPKNSTFKMSNLIINDDILPPMPNDLKFRVEGNTYGTTRGTKGWKFLFSYVLFGHYKK